MTYTCRYRLDGGPWSTSYTVPGAPHYRGAADAVVTHVRRGAASEVSTIDVEVTGPGLRAPVVETYEVRREVRG